MQKKTSRSSGKPSSLRKMHRGEHAVTTSKRANGLPSALDTQARPPSDFLMERVPQRVSVVVKGYGPDAESVLRAADEVLADLKRHAGVR